VASPYPSGIVSTLRHTPVTLGPRWYRTRLRLYGPFVALLPPALLGLVAILSLELADSATSGLIGLVGGVIAAPGLLFVGAPLAESDRYPLAVAASVPLWLLIGFVASRRATRSPMATWREYWREYTYLAAGVAIGAIGALVAATAVLGESLL
jgi:uncharacterized membrane protein YfcA